MPTQSVPLNSLPITAVTFFQNFRHLDREALAWVFFTALSQGPSGSSGYPTIYHLTERAHFHRAHAAFTFQQITTISPWAYPGHCLVFSSQIYDNAAVGVCTGLLRAGEETPEEAAEVERTRPEFEAMDCRPMLTTIDVPDEVTYPVTIPLRLVVQEPLLADRIDEGISKMFVGLTRHMEPQRLVFACVCSDGRSLDTKLQLYAAGRDLHGNSLELLSPLQARVQLKDVLVFSNFAPNGLSKISALIVKGLLNPIVSFRQLREELAHVSADPSSGMVFSHIGFCDGLTL